MVRWAMAIAALSATVTGAAAQQLPVTDWSGSYAGLSAGAIRADGGAVLDDYRGPIISLDVENGIFPQRRSPTDLGPIGGFHVGYAMQRGTFVGGVEADLGFTNVEARSSFTRTDTDPLSLFFGVTTTTQYLTRIDNLATLRLRGGYAHGRTLFYATGGLAAGRVTNRFLLEFDLPYENAWRAREVRFGYALGAGVEHRIERDLSIRAELVHFDLADATVRARDRDTPGFAGEGIDYRFKNRGQVARVGLSFRF